MQLFLHDGSGAQRKPITVESGQIGAGGAGSVRRVVGDDRHVVKLYHKPDDGLAGKVAAMLAAPPQQAVVQHNGTDVVELAWPNALVRDGSGRFLGYRMRRVDLSSATTLEEILTRAARSQAGHRDDLGFRLFVARNLASVAADVHAAGHSIIDLKPPNVLVYRDSGFIGLIDCDGFSIRSRADVYPAEMFTIEYLAPEGHSSTPGRLGIEQDAFAFAVIAFQLLNEGIHPFQGRPGPASRESDPTDIAGAIVAGIYPYRNDRPEPRKVPTVQSIHRGFPPALRSAFDRAFTKRPADRPNMVEWRDLLDALTGQVKTCSTNPEHQFIGDSCAYCAREQERAAEKSRQRAAPPPPLTKPSTPRRAQPAAQPQPASVFGAPRAGNARTRSGTNTGPFVVVNNTASPAAGGARASLIPGVIAAGVLVILGLGYFLVSGSDSSPSSDTHVRRTRQVMTAAGGATVRSLDGSEEMAKLAGGKLVPLADGQFCGLPADKPVGIRLSDGRVGLVSLTSLSSRDRQRLTDYCLDSPGGTPGTPTNVQSVDAPTNGDAPAKPAQSQRRGLQVMVVLGGAPVFEADRQTVIARLPGDTLVDLAGNKACGDGWAAKVRLADGREGYLPYDAMSSRDRSRLPACS
ncbi:hypothetical protein HUE56_29835 (plasmid) [Azospirillum oryzae]|uniref:Protein kinase domain-containing protein n=1 Tax=Azospirillum oryzae TaxID=286727 RepID=A0A6N1ASC2_9PROT|nr:MULTISPECIES: hypothetical protein [Azospirillum]KAA0584722.1 hypothetical protein FZ938_28430 [Azospirillum oryzae]QKS54705.1 hypothetical protein HUE56_29835 [Azospirillum oryzae]GLR77598.1 hypothetical protein GCM10007856_02660 [Azospirillum oryzae]